MGNRNHRNQMKDIDSEFEDVGKGFVGLGILMVLIVSLFWIFA